MHSFFPSQPTTGPGGPALAFAPNDQRPYPSSRAPTGRNVLQNPPSAPSDSTTASGVQNVASTVPLHRPVFFQGTTASSPGFSNPVGPDSFARAPARRREGENAPFRPTAPVGIQGKLDLRTFVNGEAGVLNQPTPLVRNRGERPFGPIVNGGADASAHLEGPLRKKTKMSLGAILNGTDLHPHQYASHRLTMPSDLTSNQNAHSLPGHNISQDNSVDLLSSASIHSVPQHGVTDVFPQRNNWAHRGGIGLNSMSSIDPRLVKPPHPPGASLPNAFPQNSAPITNMVGHNYNSLPSGSSNIPMAQGPLINQPPVDSNSAFINAVPSTFQPGLVQQRMRPPPMVPQSDWLIDEHGDVVLNLLSNQSGLNRDFGQPSIRPPTNVSVTGHGAPAMMPNAPGSFTSEVSACIANPRLLQQQLLPSGQELSHPPFNNYHIYPDGRIAHISPSTNNPSLFTPTFIVPSSTSQSPLTPTNSPESLLSSESSPQPCSKKRGRKPKGLQSKGEQVNGILPSQTLYYEDEAGRFVCKYVGPASVTGCAQSNSNLRCLIRHLQKHARDEVRLNVAECERMACNGVPDAILKPPISCGLPEDELHKCKHYRENGERWVVNTMERWEEVTKKHKEENHDSDVVPTPKGKKRTSKRKKRD